MGILQPLKNKAGYLKAGFLGFNKSGKTYTAVELALGAWRERGGAGRIVVYDTEAGSPYIIPRIERETGALPLGVCTRSFADLLAVTREIEPGDVLVVDSVTHPWRDLCETYLRQVNESRERRGKRKQFALEFQDWGPIKRKWAEWSDWYLNSEAHVIICGRAGFEYDRQQNEKTGKEELVKTGVKMKTEAEFGFEPSLLVEMERVSQEGGGFHHRATVIGDRFGVIDGQWCDDPTFDFFRPHFELLSPDGHAAVDTSAKPAFDELAEDDWPHEKRQREIFCEEIQGLLVSKIPGQKAEDKKRKADLIDAVFSTRSWTKVEGLSSGRLKQGLAELRTALESDEQLARAGAGEVF